jgi:hypothetical protein
MDIYLWEENFKQLHEEYEDLYERANRIKEDLEIIQCTHSNKLLRSMIHNLEMMNKLL